MGLTLIVKLLRSKDEDTEFRDVHTQAEFTSPKGCVRNATLTQRKTTHKEWRMSEAIDFKNET